MTVAYRTSNLLVDLVRAHQLMRGLDRYYPEFDHWYFNKVVPGVLSGLDGLILAETKAGLAGAALVKLGLGEQKIRCVRVDPRFKGRGLAIHLMDGCLRMADCDKPAISVAEELVHDWSRILVNRFGFSLSHVEKGAYRPRVLEYFFNGRPAQETPYGRM